MPRESKAIGFLNPFTICLMVAVIVQLILIVIVFISCRMKRKKAAEMKRRSIKEASKSGRTSKSSKRIPNMAGFKGTKSKTNKLESKSQTLPKLKVKPSEEEGSIETLNSSEEGARVKGSAAKSSSTVEKPPEDVNVKLMQSAMAVLSKKKDPQTAGHQKPTHSNGGQPAPLKDYETQSMKHSSSSDSQKNRCVYIQGKHFSHPGCHRNLSRLSAGGSPDTNPNMSSGSESSNEESGHKRKSLTKKRGSKKV